VTEAAADPIQQFTAWFDEAMAAGVPQPEAMNLATVDAVGQPNCRVVLLKAADAQGFVFYTNLESQKGTELAAQPRAALCFFWEPVGRQVRVRGRVEPVGEAEADAYFASRPRDSQIGAWASQQSRPLESRAALERRVAELEAQHAGATVPRPPHWSGLRLVPDEIELWQQGEARLHTRQLYTRDGDSWQVQLLNP